MSDAPTAAPVPSKAQVFLRRLITTVILWTVILAALFSAHPLVSDGVCILILIFLAVTGLAEFYGLAEKRGLACFKWCGIIGGVLLLAGTFLHLTTKYLGINDSPARANDFETGFLILFVLGLCVRQFISKTNTTGILTISTTLFGLMYVPSRKSSFSRSHRLALRTTGNIFCSTSSSSPSSATWARMPLARSSGNTR